MRERTTLGKSISSLPVMIYSVLVRTPRSTLYHPNYFFRGRCLQYSHAHDDPMVITIQIANCLVHRVLIDIESSVDILFKRPYDKLNLKNPCCNNCTTPLYGFTGDSLMPVGSHRLPVIIGEAPLQLNLMTEFVIVDTPSAYNAILERPFLVENRGVLSIYHNVLKFPVGKIKFKKCQPQR